MSFNVMLTTEALQRHFAACFSSHGDGVENAGNDADQMNYSALMNCYLQLLAKRRASEKELCFRLYLQLIRSIAK